MIGVIGGANMDILGRSDKSLAQGDSNPGRIRFAHGGVGRNIAETLLRLGAAVCFLSAVGADTLSAEILQRLEHLGGDVSRCIKKGEAPSVYMAIHDMDGEMRLGMNDMTLAEELTPAYLHQYKEDLAKWKLLVVDGNLPRESYGYLEKINPRIVFDPVSVAKAVRNGFPIFPYMKMNRMEAEAYTGENEPERQGEKLLALGAEMAVITLGAEGALACDGNGAVRILAQRTEIENVTGAGDGFTAGFAYGLSQGWRMEQSCEMGVTCAAYNLASQAPVNEELMLKDALIRMRRI
ncbi:carbohydrate kinase family protein [Eubacteriales bacterium OttesenSCG-928-M02]|nr:carbohydrate kinase family protein [Eubacteriales bacterium OttesenSCG-928-M02]